MAGNFCRACTTPIPMSETLCLRCDRQSYPMFTTSIPLLTVPSLPDWDPEPPKPLEKIQSTEPIVAYRVWKLDRKECQLKSCIMNYNWPLRRRLCKDEFNNAGIHAVKKISRLDSLWKEYHSDVAGSIYMWGEVTECRDGYLAEFAYPKQLWMPEDTDPCIVMQLEENYGVPCDLRREFVKNAEKPDEIYAVLGSWVSYNFRYTSSVPLVSDPQP